MVVFNMIKCNHNIRQHMMTSPYFRRAALAACISSLCVNAPAGADEIDNFTEALTSGKVTFNARLRYETVDQDGIAEDAESSTLRTRLGYGTGEFHGLSGYLELEHIAEIIGEYNNTRNGKTMYPVVADVEGTEIEQAFLSFTGIPETRIRVGREHLAIGNQRFIGPVGWRQGAQSFDNANIVTQLIPETTLTYAYIDGVNRINGLDWESDSHVIHAKTDILPIGAVSAYGYFIDLEEAPAMSSATYGASLNGAFAATDDIKLHYRAEYAKQSDYGDNPNDYDAHYFHIAPGVSYKKLKLTLGYEVLGSDDGMFAFTTPLATLHKFNGWSDKFLMTPAGGLEDAYIDISYNTGDDSGIHPILDNVLVKGQYHIFTGEDAVMDDYGDEFGIFLKKTFRKHYYGQIKYAHYNAEDFSSDTQKWIFDIGVKF